MCELHSDAIRIYAQYLGEMGLCNKSTMKIWA
jgi:hypothetical protein